MSKDSHAQTLMKEKLGIVRFLSVWLYLSVAASAWALATPLAASPDEPAHIIKAAAVAQGEFAGEPTDQAAVTRVRVPESVATASSWPCFAFQSNVSAGCIPESQAGTTLVEATTSAGLYNPTYYALVGWPTRFVDDGATAVYLMRIISAIIVALFLTITWFGLRAISGPVIGGVTFLALATPMVFFLAGVVNPNALEIATGVAFITSLLWLLRNSTSEHQRSLWLASLAVSGVILANSRGISPFWLVLFVVLAMVSTPWPNVVSQFKDIKFLVSTFVVILGVIASGLWVFSSGTLGAMGNFPGAGEVTPLRAFLKMILQRSADPGLIGVFGWLDTVSPNIVYAIWTILIGGFITCAFMMARGKALITVIVSVLAFIGAPALIQAASVQKSGFIWQGRYSLAIMGAMLILCSVVIAETFGKSITGRHAVKLSYLVAGAVLFGQVFAFVSVLGRYVTGDVEAVFAALGAGEWNPPLGSKLWFALISLAFTALLAQWIIPIRKRAGQASTGSLEYPTAGH